MTPIVQHETSAREFPDGVEMPWASTGFLSTLETQAMTNSSNQGKFPSASCRIIRAAHCYFRRNLIASWVLFNSSDSERAGVFYLKCVPARGFVNEIRCSIAWAIKKFGREPAQTVKDPIFCQRRSVVELEASRSLANRGVFVVRIFLVCLVTGHEISLKSFLLSLDEI